MTRITFGPKRPEKPGTSKTDAPRELLYYIISTTNESAVNISRQPIRCRGWDTPFLEGQYRCPNRELKA